MTPEALIKKLLAQRDFWVDVAAGKRIKLRRPAEMEWLGLLVREEGKVVGLRVGLPEVKRQAVDWEGFAEADLIHSGASDAVAFHPDLFAAVIEDKSAWCAKCAEALSACVIDYLQAQEDAAGN